MNSITILTFCFIIWIQSGLACGADDKWVMQSLIELDAIDDIQLWSKEMDALESKHSEDERILNWIKCFRLVYYEKRLYSEAKRAFVKEFNNNTMKDKKYVIGGMVNGAKIVSVDQGKIGIEFHYMVRKFIFYSEISEQE